MKYIKHFESVTPRYKGYDYPAHDYPSEIIDLINKISSHLKKLYSPEHYKKFLNKRGNVNKSKIDELVMFADKHGDADLYQMIKDYAESRSERDFKNTELEPTFEELRIWKPEIGDVIRDKNGDEGTILKVSDKGVASIDYGDGISLSTYTIDLKIVGKKGGKNIWQSIKEGYGDHSSPEITYEQAVESLRLRKIVADYVSKHYPEKGYNKGKGSLLGAYGRGLTSGKVEKIRRFATKVKDAELMNLLGEYASFEEELRRPFDEYVDEIDIDI